MTFGRVILGDNQFLGVNHSSQAKASELFDRFKSTDKIIEIIGTAYNSGVRDFMFTTHERYDEVFNEIRRSDMFKGMYYSPCVPYAHKYWDQISEEGVVRVISSTLFKISPVRAFPAGLAALIGRKQGIVRLLADLELYASRGLPLRGIFLQNLAFDFLMAMELFDFIEAFSSAVAMKFNALPGFVTMNHVRAVDVLCGVLGMNRPWVCANFNSAGFRMNPSQAACEDSFASLRTNNIAMSIFASGTSAPGSAIEYVKSRFGGGGVNSVLFGSGNPLNVRANVEALSI